MEICFTITHFNIGNNEESMISRHAMITPLHKCAYCINHLIVNNHIISHNHQQSHLTKIKFNYKCCI